MWHSHFDAVTPRWQIVSDEYMGAILAAELSAKELVPRWTRCLLCRPHVGDATWYLSTMDHLKYWWAFSSLLFTQAGPHHNNYGHSHHIEKGDAKQGVHWLPLSYEVPMHSMIMVEKGGEVTFEWLWSEMNNFSMLDIKMRRPGDINVRWLSTRDRRWRWDCGSVIDKLHACLFAMIHKKGSKAVSLMDAGNRCDAGWFRSPSDPEACYSSRLLCRTICGVPDPARLFSPPCMNPWSGLWRLLSTCSVIEMIISFSLSFLYLYHLLLHIVTYHINYYLLLYHSLLTSLP